MTPTPIPPPIKNNIVLRDWQQEVISKLDTIQEKNIMINAPTGGGKAFLIMALVTNLVACGKKVLLLVDRVALVNQLSASANQFNLSHNVLQGGNRIDNNALFTIASLQTFFNTEFVHDNYDVIFIDEAHTLYNSVTDYLKLYSGRVYGLTATAITKGLGNLYNTIINATTAAKLTQSGALVNFKPVVMTKINMDGAKVVAGEWSSNEVHKRSASIYGDVVSGYKQLANNKRAICFCANTAHCEDVANQFSAQGIPVGVYTSKTKESDRVELLRKFDNKEIMILISVSALSKGFDKPYIEAILDLRPLRRSLAEYIQMVGRGLRTCEGKQGCLLIDFSGNWDRFADDYEYIYHNGVDSLDGSDIWLRPRSDYESNSKTCLHCGNQYSYTCRQCGKTDLKPRTLTVEIDNIVPLAMDRIVPTESNQCPFDTSIMARETKNISVWDKFKNFMWR